MKSFFTQLGRKGSKLSKRDSISSRFESLPERNTPYSTPGALSLIEQPDLPDKSIRSDYSTSDGFQETSRVTRDQRQNIRLSQKIASISNQLRQMYALDLLIYGRENCLPEEEEGRETMITEANVLFESITSTLAVWENDERCNGCPWSREELDIIHNIRRKAYEHDPRKYRQNRKPR